MALPMSDQSHLKPVIGILYPGEMGTALGRVLVEAGFRVVTTLEGRSSRTHRLGREAGLEILASLTDVVRTSAIVFSVVAPGAAAAVARQFCAAAQASLWDRFPNLSGQVRTGLETCPPDRLFVDANSVSPVTAAEIAALTAAAGIECVDAAVYGLASQLRTRGTVYLSGRSAATVAALFGGKVRTRVMGDTPGKASLMKSLLAGLNKGLVALFLEMSQLACEGGLVDQLFEAYRASYPGVMEVVERLLPTYPQHAPRRAQEMEELEHTLRSLGLQPAVTRGARQVTAAFAQLGLPEKNNFDPANLPVLVKEAHARGLLRDSDRTHHSPLTQRKASW
jgi:3-hydroxyisobutyrate dehydrogenase-like beta-hydroxyacid dehydrogenase